MNSFVQGDTLPILRVFLKDISNSNRPLDLTNVQTVILRFQITEDGLVTERPMIIGDAVGGMALYQFGTSELQPDTLIIEVVVIDSTGRQVTTIDSKSFGVRERLD